MVRTDIPPSFTVDSPSRGRAWTVPRSLWPASLLCVLAGAIHSSGCAVSPVDPNSVIEEGVDASTSASSEPPADPTGPDVAMAADAAPARDAGSRESPGPTRDAGATTDARIAPVTDAATGAASPAKPSDAGSTSPAVPVVQDAAAVAVDAGSTPPAPDASTATPPSVAPPAPEPPIFEAQTCGAHADCTGLCFPIGAIACCKADKTCGCSWATDAYCL